MNACPIRTRACLASFLFLPGRWGGGFIGSHLVPWITRSHVTVRGNLSVTLSLVSEIASLLFSPLPFPRRSRHRVTTDKSRRIAIFPLRSYHCSLSYRPKHQDGRVIASAGEEYLVTKYNIRNDHDYTCTNTVSRTRVNCTIVETPESHDLKPHKFLCRSPLFLRYLPAFSDF